MREDTRQYVPQPFNEEVNAAANEVGEMSGFLVAKMGLSAGVSWSDVLLIDAARTIMVAPWVGQPASENVADMDLENPEAKRRVMEFFSAIYDEQVAWGHEAQRLDAERKAAKSDGT